MSRLLPEPMSGLPAATSGVAHPQPNVPVAADHTVSWQAQRWGVPREQVCAGLRGARVEIERRLDGSEWLRFRGRYLPLHPCPEAPRSATPSGLRPTGVADAKP